jgi:hypothetical protein
MKLVQYNDQKHVTLSPSTFKDGLDIKVEDKVILSIIPEGFENVKVILPLGSTIKVYRSNLDAEFQKLAAEDNELS